MFCLKNNNNFICRINVVRRFKRRKYQLYSLEYNKTYKLRENVMRKPLGLLLSAEDVKDDNIRS